VVLGDEAGDDVRIDPVGLAAPAKRLGVEADVLGIQDIGDAAAGCRQLRQQPVVPAGRLHGDGAAWRQGLEPGADRPGLVGNGLGLSVGVGLRLALAGNDQLGFGDIHTVKVLCSGHGQFLKSTENSVCWGGTSRHYVSLRSDRPSPWLCSQGGGSVLNRR
jgi:hypothetical protein